MRATGGRQRGLTPIIGNILLVAVALIVALTLVVMSFGFVDEVGAPVADASFEYERTPAGLEMTPRALGTDVSVNLNGEQVTTLAADSAGTSVQLPTAPGDRITVVSTDGDRSVLVQEEVDERSEVGDFIAYYEFDGASGSAVADKSGNDNDGTASGGYSWGGAGDGTYMAFDGSTGTHVDMGDLTVDGPAAVEEITVAIKYRKDGGATAIQNLIEHQSGAGGAGNFAWYIETDGKHTDPHRMEFDVGYKSSPSGSVTTGDIPEREPQVLVGTYDGTEMVFYRNGTTVGTRTFSRDVSLGEIILAADSRPSGVGQNLKGRLYEVRLYYTAFDEEEVGIVTDAMD